MILGLRTNTHLNMLMKAQMRYMSAASTASIKSRFETAYQERIKSIRKAGAKR